MARYKYEQHPLYLPKVGTCPAKACKAVRAMAFRAHGTVADPCAVAYSSFPSFTVLHFASFPSFSFPSSFVVAHTHTLYN